MLGQYYLFMIGRKKIQWIEHIGRLNMRDSSRRLSGQCVNDIDRAAVAKRHMFHNVERLGKLGR